MNIMLVELFERKKGFKEMFQRILSSHKLILLFASNVCHFYFHEDMHLANQAYGHSKLKTCFSSLFSENTMRHLFPLSQIVETLFFF